MYKFLHCADTHLRDSQYGRTSRQKDFFNAFESIVEIAKKEQVHAVFCCGDIFNSVRISPAIQSFAQDQHMHLLESNIPMYVISGNHDKTSPHWAEIVRRKDDDPNAGFVFLDCTKAEIPGTPFSVVGVPSISDEEFKSRWIKWPEADFLLWHGMVGDFLPEIAQHSGSKLTSDDLPLDRYSAILLGDLHIRDYRKFKNSSNGECLVGYPGSAELCYSNEDKTKTVTLFTYDEHKELQDTRYVPVHTRDYLTLTVLSEEQMDNSIQHLKNWTKEQPPIVFLKYDPAIPDVKERIRTVIPGGEKIVIPSPVRALDKAGNKKVNEIDDSKTIYDFIPHFINADQPQYALGSKLLDPEPEVPANALVDDYMDKRMKDLNIK